MIPFIFFFSLGQFLHTHRVDTLRDPLLRKFHNQAYSHRLDVYMYLYLVQVMKVPVDPATLAAVPLEDGVPDLWPLIGMLVRRWVRTATRNISQMMLEEVGGNAVWVHDRHTSTCCTARWTR